MIGDLKNGRTVKSLVKLLSRYSGNHFNFVSPKELSFPKQSLPKNSFETTKIDDVINEIKKYPNFVVSVLSKSFIGSEGRVTGQKRIAVEWAKDSNRYLKMTENIQGLLTLCQSIL